MIKPRTTGRPTVLGICLSNSGSLPILIAFAAPEHNAVPTVKNNNSCNDTDNGDIAYEQIELNVTRTVKFGFVNLRYAVNVFFKSDLVLGNTETG